MKIKSFKDIYKLPFEDIYIDEEGFRSKMIYDTDGNFVFQFGEGVSPSTEIKILNVLNGIEELEYKRYLHVEDGKIIYRGLQGSSVLIFIRGWGNLTGIRRHRLTSDEAKLVQDTLADYILDRLGL